MAQPYVSLRRFTTFVTSLAEAVNAKINTSAIKNNDTTTSSGYVADARIVKTHGDEIDTHTTQLGGLYFGTDSSGNWGYATTSSGDVTPFRNPTGNATAAQVLSGKTFSNASAEDISGTMNNWGSNTVNMSSNTATLSAGYYSGISINAASRYTAGYNSGYSAGNSAGYNSGYSAGNSAGYNAKTMTITSLGTKTATSAKANFTFNAANISGYGNLTVSNFAITNQIMTVTAGGSGSGSDGWNINISISNTCTPKLAYNASNGILTVSNCYSYGACTNTITTTAYAYISSLTVKAYVC